MERPLSSSLEVLQQLGRATAAGYSTKKENVRTCSRGGQAEKCDPPICPPPHRPHASDQAGSGRGERAQLTRPSITTTAGIPAHSCIGIYKCGHACFSTRVPCLHPHKCVHACTDARNSRPLHRCAFWGALLASLQTLVCISARGDESLQTLLLVRITACGWSLRLGDVCFGMHFCASCCNTQQKRVYKGMLTP